MHEESKTKRLPIRTRIIALVVSLSLVVPYFALFGTVAFPKKASAQAYTATKCIAQFFGISTAEQVSKELPIGVPTVVQNFSTTVQAGQAQSSFLKDCVEKGLALAMARYLLNQMTNQIVTWINSGFNGNPAFISDPGQFLLNMGDQIAGEFILGSDLAFLCSPFKLQIQLSLALNYYSGSFAEQARCTLTQAIGNAENALNDLANGFDFEKQGWGGWLQMTQNDQNNPYGAYLMAESQLNARIAGAQNIELLKLDWSGGFLSWEECIGPDGSTVPKSNDPSKKPGVNCQIKTPGRVIAGVLDKQLGVPADQLGVADDLDKILNALANQLLMQGARALLGSYGFGSGGLIGQSQPSTEYNGRSILQELEAQSLINQSEAEQSASDAQNNLDNIQNSSTTPEQTPTNVALNKTSLMSSVDTDYDNSSSRHSAFPANAGNDGDKQSLYNVVATLEENEPWWQTDLGQLYDIDSVKIYWLGGGHGPFYIFISDRQMSRADSIADLRARGDVFEKYSDDSSNPSSLRNLNTRGRYIRLMKVGNTNLRFIELEAFATNPALDVPADTYTPDAPDTTSTVPPTGSNFTESTVNGWRVVQVGTINGNDYPDHKYLKADCSLTTRATSSGMPNTHISPTSANQKVVFENGVIKNLRNRKGMEVYLSDSRYGVSATDFVIRNMTFENIGHDYEACGNYPTSYCRVHTDGIYIANGTPNTKVTFENITFKNNDSTTSLFMFDAAKAKTVILKNIHGTGNQNKANFRFANVENVVFENVNISFGIVSWPKTITLKGSMPSISDSWIKTAQNNGVVVVDQRS